MRESETSVRRPRFPDVGGGIHGAVVLEPANVVVRLPAQHTEIAAHQNLPVPLHRQGVNRAVWPRIEGIHRGRLGVEAGGRQQAQDQQEAGEGAGRKVARFGSHAGSLGTRREGVKCRRR